MGVALMLVANLYQSKEKPLKRHLKTTLTVGMYAVWLLRSRNIGFTGHIPVEC